MCTDADSHIPPPPLPWPFVAQVIVWQYHDCWEQDERWTLSKPQEYSPAQLQKSGVCTLAHAQEEVDNANTGTTIKKAIIEVIRLDGQYIEQAKQRLRAREAVAKQRLRAREAV